MQGPVDEDEAVVVDREGFSKIWIVPLIALVVGLWLGYQQYLHRPVTIIVHFSSGDGIVVGKTEVKFEGIKVGTVTDMTVEDSLRGVRAVVEMDYRTQHYLVAGTQFWLVKPEVSFSGVTGLDTLMSGNYVGMKVGGGAALREFTALESAPPPDETTPGLHLVLNARDLGSLHVGSPVTYRKITVGAVSQYLLKDDGRGVQFKVVIDAEYAHLVKKGSRFWNNSGLRVAAGLSGVDVRMESLATLVAGGVSFDTPTHGESVVATNGEQYDLYANYDAAKSAAVAFIRFPDAKGLQKGVTQVRYKGFVVGEVKNIRHEPVAAGQPLNGAVARVGIDPQYEPFLRTGTRFWLVKPELSLSEISGLDTLLSGAYIEILPGDGEPQNRFDALLEPPRVDYSQPGIRVKLLADEMPSVSRGSPILYRKVPVGEVQSFELADDGKRIVVNAFIEARYAHLLRNNSRFWNASGLSIKGGLGGINVQTGSVKSLLVGGIGFHTPENAPRQTDAREGQTFPLYADYDKAAEQGIEIRVRFPQNEGLEVGAPIKYQGIVLGEVRRVFLDNDFRHVVVAAYLKPEGAKLARAGARFWVVKAQLGVTGAAHLDTLIKGNYLAVEPAPGELGAGPTLYAFDGQSGPSVQRTEIDGLNVVVWARQRGSVKPGTQVLYRQMPVGSVKSVELSDNAQSVMFYINIEPRFVPLVRVNSVFWNASGIEVDFGLFKGASVRTESVEALLEGGIAFASPEPPELGKQAEQDMQFKLYDKPQSAWLEWAPAIQLASP
ncbi:putative paraquat-inducible protein b [gamma proteobacterium HdN1]|nr:putative paraquat-inducible protein b [gamma proteobacterium HdN1]